MNVKNVLVGSALFISSNHLLAAAISAQEDVFGPGPRSSHAAGEESEVAAANKPASTTENNQRCYCIDEADSAAVEEIKHALHCPLPETGLEFTDTPFTQVISDIQDRYAIPIHLDRTAMEELGVSVEEPVTVSLRNISLQAALRLILRPLNLTYVIEHEVLLITTPDKSEADLLTCVYDVRDLAITATAAPTKGASPPAYDSRLAVVITKCIAKDTWSKNGGGNAEIQALGPDLLVISQTRAVHEKIQNLLSAIRRLKSIESRSHNGSPSPGSPK